VSQIQSKHRATFSDRSLPRTRSRTTARRGVFRKRRDNPSRKEVQSQQERTATSRITLSVYKFGGCSFLVLAMVDQHLCDSSVSCPSALSQRHQFPISSYHLMVENSRRTASPFACDCWFSKWSRSIAIFRSAFQQVSCRCIFHDFPEERRTA